MMAKTHFLGGVILTSSIVLALTQIGVSDVVAAISFVAGGALGSVCPDIDEPNSYISRKHPVISGLFSLKRGVERTKVNNIFNSKDERGLARQRLRDMSHRGITHYMITWLIPLLFTTLICAIAFRHTPTFWEKIALVVLEGVFLGGVSHILLDLISGRIPCLAPFSRRSYGVCLIKTDGLLERFIVRPAFMILVLFIWYKILVPAPV